MKKILSLLVVALLAMPLSIAKEDKAVVEVCDALGNKIMVKHVELTKAKEIEKELMHGNLRILGIKFDYGIANLIISYGKGKVYIPFSKERSFIRLMLRPIFFNYEEGFTIVKFGANYFWKGKSIGDFGLMLRKHQGVMIGFLGIHIRIRYKLQPDTHIFIGGCWLILGRDKLL
ncbi:MAG: hypothetical protein DRN11_01310 [Thermoplasmata archaeon]|nr:MAG: hypothetical protein DRN11_01310 [Thermoplasmata archaeon]